MSDQQQLAAWAVVFEPAFTALLVLTIIGVVLIVWDDLRQTRRKEPYGN